MSKTANEPAALATDSPALTGGSHHQVATDPNPFQVPPSRVGLYMTDDHRYYVGDLGPFPSVTTILRVLDKPAVAEWLQNQTATAAMLHLSELVGISVEDGVKLIRSYPREAVDRAASLGSYVHYLADMAPRASETDAKPFEVSPEAFPYIEAFRGFLGRYGASSIVSSEKAVWSKTEGFAGTYDLLMTLPATVHGCEDPDGHDGEECSCPDELWLIDIKTSKGYYPEYGLQLAAYSHAEYIVLPDDPTLYPMPKVQRTGILHLRPDAYEGPMQQGWRLVEYPTTDRDYVAFLAALELYQWKGERRFSKKILDSSIQKPI